MIGIMLYWAAYLTYSDSSPKVKCNTIHWWQSTQLQKDNMIISNMQPPNIVNITSRQMFLYFTRKSNPKPCNNILPPLCKSQGTTTFRFQRKSADADWLVEQGLTSHSTDADKYCGVLCYYIVYYLCQTQCNCALYKNYNRCDSMPCSVHNIRFFCLLFQVILCSLNNTGILLTPNVWLLKFTTEHIQMKNSCL